MADFTATVTLGSRGATGSTGATGDWSTAQTIRTVSGTKDTPTSADAGDLVQFTSASAVTVTIGTSLGLTAGQRIDFLQMGAGQVTFSASSTTVNGTPTLKTRAQYSAASLICLASDTYVLVGDLAAF